MWVTFHRFSTIFEAFVPHFNLCCTHCIIPESLLNQPNNLCQGMFKLNTNFDSDLLLYSLIHFVFLFKKDFIYLFLGRGERGGEREGHETPICGCVSRTSYWGPGPQPRNVPWVGIEQVTLWFCRLALNLLSYTSQRPFSHFECGGHTVHMLTQRYVLLPLTSTVKSSLFIHVHSSLGCRVTLMSCKPFLLY